MDFGQHRIVVRGGKGGKDRTTLLPRTLRDELQAQIEAVARTYPKALRETG